MNKQLPNPEKRARRAWYLYDFGNSAYAAIILLAVFSVYFKNVVVGGAAGTRLWGIAVGIASIVVAVISPVLGAIADVARSKKTLLLIFTIISVIFTALLFFVRAGNVVSGMIFFIFAEIGYRAAQVFYDALLTDVSTPETVGATSGIGWALGMLGGIVALLLVLLPIQLIGDEVIPYAFLITAVFYLLSSLPTFLFVKEKRAADAKAIRQGITRAAFRKLLETFREVRKHKEFLKYALAFLTYNDGIMMLMDFAAIIGATLFGMGQVQLIVFVILIHLSGAMGAYLFGKYADRRSSKRSILISLFILMVAVSCLFVIENLWLFYSVGFVAGFSLSGAQAVSRSMVSQLVPVDQISEFFGFLSVAGRTSTFVGPLVFSTTSFRMHNWYLNHGFNEQQAEHYGLLWAIATIVLFLIVGSLLLLLVRQKSKGDRLDRQ